MKPHLLLLFIIAGRALPAQQPVITPETSADYATLHRWLHSGDPRQIAWAAEFTRRTHDPEILTEMPALLEHWTLPPSLGDSESRAAQVRAIQAVLDTLIQANASVPPSAIAKIAESFPAQAVNLIVRVPLYKSRSTLEDWSYANTGSMWTAATLARVSAMLLAKDPATSRGFWNDEMVSFVASVLAASEQEVVVTLRSSNTSSPGTGSGSCGDSFGHPLQAGWPEVYTYDLQENPPAGEGNTVVELDGDSIVSRRYKENGGWGSCNAVEPLDPTTRHRLIAHWLGVPDNAMHWQPIEGETIVWSNYPAYLERLGKITEAHRQKLHATVEALRQRGLMSESEAAAIAPKLIITIHCEIEPCPLH